MARQSCRASCAPCSQAVWLQAEAPRLGGGLVRKQTDAEPTLVAETELPIPRGIGRILRHRQEEMLTSVVYIDLVDLVPTVHGCIKLAWRSAWSPSWLLSSGAAQRRPCVHQKLQTCMPTWYTSCIGTWTHALCRSCMRDEESTGCMCSRRTTVTSRRAHASRETGHTATPVVTHITDARFRS